MGPVFDTDSDSQAKASYLISIAELRKDCIATISPHRAHLIGITNTTTQTNNLIKFFSSLSSSSYAIFDSGYKYTYDRFNNKFVYDCVAEPDLILNCVLQDIKLVSNENSTTHIFYYDDDNKIVYKYEKHNNNNYQELGLFIGSII
jgi:hypothetical protein